MENGDKLSEEDKATVQSELEEFKKVKESGDAEQIKAAIEPLTQKVYQIFGKLYQQEGEAGRARYGPGAGWRSPGRERRRNGEYRFRR